MYVSPISTRLFGGRSTPAIRAMVLPLPLFVLGVHANHAHDALTVNDFAFVTDFFNRCSDFHKNPYLYRYTIRPRVRSYGDSSTATLSPGRIRMKFLRMRPETCARTWCLFSSSTLNMAFGNGSITVAMTSIASSLLKQF